MQSRYTKIVSVNKRKATKTRIKILTPTGRRRKNTYKMDTNDDINPKVSDNEPNISEQIAKSCIRNFYKYFQSDYKFTLEIQNCM